MNLFNNAIILKLNKMKMESLTPVKYVKNINKNKVALPRIESYLEKTGKEALINIVENLVTKVNLKIHGDFGLFNATLTIPS